RPTKCPLPLGAAEHRKVKTDQREDCLSPSKMGEFRSAGFGRGAQGSRREALTKPWGAVSFGYFSLRHSKEK
ncbi:MAG: hypothetical protein WBN00_17345, partial [Sedimenticolaceae bacterium]